MELAFTRRRVQRLLHAEIRGGKRIRHVERAHREVVRGPRADARQRDEARDERVEIVRRVELHALAHDRARELEDRRGARTRHPDLRDAIDADTRDIGRRRKSRRERSGCARIERGAERSREPPGERRRAGDGDLLSQHRADRGFERIERAGQAQPGPRVHEPREDRIGTEHARDRIGPRIEV